MSVQIKVSKKAYDFIVQKTGRFTMKLKRNVTMIETVDMLLFKKKGKK